MSLIKVAWYVLWVKNMHFGSPSDPTQTTAVKAKLSYVYLILKPHFRVLSLPQSQSQAVVCVSTPRTYLRSGYFLFLQKEESILLTSELHHLPRVGPKQLCALAHLRCIRAADTSYLFRKPWTTLNRRVLVKSVAAHKISYLVSNQPHPSSGYYCKWKSNVVCEWYF